MIRIPERLNGRNEFHGDFGNERLQPRGAIFHSRLLRHHVPKDDQGFLLARGNQILGVLDDFPFASLAHDQNVDVLAGQQAKRTVSSETGWEQ